MTASTLFGNYTFSKGFDTSTRLQHDYGPQDPTNLIWIAVFPSLIRSTNW